MRPGVEERLRYDLQPSLNGPAELLVLLEPLDGHGSPRPEVTRHLADLQQLLPDDVRLDCHGARVPARGGTRAGFPEVRRVEVSEDGSGLEGGALGPIATHETEPVLMIW